MRILIINAGSSSVKFSVFDMDTNVQLFHSQLDRVKSIAEAIQSIPSILSAQNITKIDAIGHRVAHGGDKYREPQLIDDDVIHVIKQCTPLAPLHNPSALAGIQMARNTWYGVLQVAVFDTAFHQTIPERAYTYAVPEKWREIGLRRYGFHGTSHKYVMMRVAEELKISATDLRIISCHLGNGASVCAIERGLSVDTSMGMTSLEGLVMGTRSGDVDPGIFVYLNQTLGLTAKQVENALYNDSGLASLSGLGNDMRDIEQQAAIGNVKAQLAIQVYAYRVRKYIGSYAAVMGGVDVIAFTGGIGENSASMRKRICERLDYLGLSFDDDKNVNLDLTDTNAPQIQESNSRVRLIVTQTREQWMIAREVARLITIKSKPVKNQTPINIAVSAHHVHLTQQAVEQLFGNGYQLKIRSNLKQPGFWVAEETVDVISRHGKIDNIRILGPCRTANQIEIAETEAYKLGIDVPVRLSGNTENTPIVTLRGPFGSIQTEGLIVAKRHIHMSSKDAEMRGLKQGEQVEVDVQGQDRELAFRDVIIRIDPQYITEMHIDTDEANAAHIGNGGKGIIIPITNHVQQSCCMRNLTIIKI